MILQINLNQSRFYLEKEKHRHWCPVSEPVTGVDALKAMLDQGWVFHNECGYHEQRVVRGRYFHQYTFCLRRGYHLMRITVTESPVLQQLIKEYKLSIERAVVSDEPSMISV